MDTSRKIELGTLLALVIAVVTFAFWLGGLAQRVGSLEQRVDKLDAALKVSADPSQPVSTNPTPAVAIPSPSSSSAECKAATITKPSGSKQREDARKFPTDGNLSISWSPADCPMIIQYYQGNQLMHEVRPAVLSGAKLRIPNQGETQIKIWYESPSGSSIADDRWLWVR